MLADHLDGVDRALAEARAAAGALGVVEAVAVALAQLDDRVIGARAQAAVAFEAVAARQAAARLVPGLLGGEPGHHFGEHLRPGRGIELALLPPAVVTEVPQVQLVHVGNRMLVCRKEFATPEIGVDGVGGLLAVPHTDGDGALARHGVTAGEDARRPGHQGDRVDLHHVAVEGQACDVLQEAGVALLAQGEDDGVGLELLESPGGLRPAVLVQFLDLDGQVVLPHLGDGPQPVDADALLLRVGRFLFVRRHLLASAAIDDDRVVGAKAPGDARGVHGRVATAIHRHASGDRAALALLDIAQERDGVEHPARVPVGDVDALGQVRADGDERGVEARHLLLEIGDGVVLLEGDPVAPQPVDLGVDDVARQAVCRDAVAHHPAGQLAVVPHRDSVPQPGQVVCRGQARRSRADDEDVLARGHAWLGIRPALRDRRVTEMPLDGVDGHRAVHEPAVAHGFARVIANPAVDGGEGVVLGELMPGAMGVAGLGERQPGLDVLTGGAAGVAGREQIDIDGPLRAHRAGAFAPGAQGR